MYDNTTEITKALLIGVDTGIFDIEQSLLELEELTKTAEAEVVGIFTQRRESYDSATCIGAGRLEEIAEFCKENQVDLIIFDDELTATQIRNIENATNVRVIDRTTLILDIFAQRARSKEGQLQVELAQQRYRLPRLAGMGVALSRLGAGIGTRGPGETKLESDKRHIRRRIAFLEKELEQLEKRRAMMRSRRKKDNVTTVAIVGYTNVGKSTLLNALTNAGVLAENKLFATLDPTARALELPDGKTVLLVDTVGLIRRLPHHLIEAFQSTLEEAANADLILHVCDVSSDEAAEQIQVTQQLLDELGCSNIPVLTVLNKCDKIAHQPYFAEKDCVMISAKTGFGFDHLLNRIAQSLEETSHRMKLLIPYSDTSFIAKIRATGKVFSEEYNEQGTLVDALVDRSLYEAAKSYLLEETK